MNKTEKAEFIAKLSNEMKKLDDKNFNVYFFVLDSKGNPSGELTYIYQLGYELKTLGYNVTMLHQEKDFAGVGSWLGKKYASLPHKNVEKENVDISAADFLFIPEIYANVMSQTKNLPCKKVAILHNQSYLTSTIPVGVTWADMHIYDVVTNTKMNEELINSYMPFVKSWVVRPHIPNMFREVDEPQQLIINVISKDQTDIDKVIKPFYWKYPVYKWVSFRDLRGLPQEDLAEALNSAAITIWMDDVTDFGYTLLEALKSGSLTLAKIPDNPTDWMVNDGKLIEGPIWFNNVRDLPEMIASVVRTWTMDSIPSEIYENSVKVGTEYTEEHQVEEIKKCILEGIFAKHKGELENAIKIAEKEEITE